MSATLPRRPRWATGIAEVVSIRGALVTVACPHCGLKHVHGRGMLGSRSVAAGCHAGPNRLREYRIVDLKAKGKA